VSDQEQTVVEEPEGAAKPAPEGESARTDDLDELLKQYESAAPASADGSSSDPESKGNGETSEGDVKELVSELVQEKRAREKAEANTAFQADMKTVVDEVRGDISGEQFNDVFVEAWLDAEARTNPNLATAWANRNTDPAHFKQVVRALGEKFTKIVKGQPDPNVTEDVEAVANAVRGASPNAPAGSTPNFGAMPQGEFDQMVNKLPRHSAG